MRLAGRSGRGAGTESGPAETLCESAVGSGAEATGETVAE